MPKNEMRDTTEMAAHVAEYSPGQPCWYVDVSVRSMRKKSKTGDGSGVHDCLSLDPERSSALTLHCDCAEAGCFNAEVVSHDPDKFKVTIKINDPDSPDDGEVPCSWH